MGRELAMSHCLLGQRSLTHPSRFTDNSLTGGPPLPRRALLCSRVPFPLVRVLACSHSPRIFAGRAAMLLSKSASETFSALWNVRCQYAWPSFRCAGMFVAFSFSFDSFEEDAAFSSAARSFRIWSGMAPCGRGGSTLFLREPRGPTSCGGKKKNGVFFLSMVGGETARRCSAAGLGFERPDLRFISAVAVSLRSCPRVRCLSGSAALRSTRPNGSARGPSRAPRPADPPDPPDDRNPTGPAKAPANSSSCLVLE